MLAALALLLAVAGAEAERVALAQEESVPQKLPDTEAEEEWLPVPAEVAESVPVAVPLPVALVLAQLPVAVWEGLPEALPVPTAVALALGEALGVPVTVRLAVLLLLRLPAPRPGVPV